METRLKGTNGFPALALFAAFALAATSPTLLPAQSSPSSPAPSSASPQILAGPPANPGFFPLSQIHAGMTGTAWTVFQGSTPEPMQVEILGVLRGARGPGQDLILVRLHGDKPEYTGVVEGMSGSPVYIDGKLAGSLSYRIGQFTKEPIAGITPIEQMLEVRDIPVRDLTPDLSAPNTEIGAQASTPAPNSSLDASNSAANQNPLAAGDLGTESDMSFRPMDTPLVMSGFLPEAIRFWQQQTAGTSLSPVAAGGSLSGSSGSGASSAPASSSQSTSTPGSEAVPPTLVPGSAVSMQLIRGDLEVSATCTVTWVDPKQLLACATALVDQVDRVAGVGQFQCGLQAGDAAADHERRRIDLHVHPFQGMLMRARVRPPPPPGPWSSRWPLSCRYGPRSSARGCWSSAAGMD